ncbi:MAG: M23 family metallopeptidase [Phycisphaerales bacterium]
MSAAFAALVVATLAQPYFAPGAPEGAPILVPNVNFVPPEGCITEAERAAVRSAITRYTTQNTTASAMPDFLPARPFGVFPIGGRQDVDLIITHLVDLNPAPLIWHDASCDGHTYDGHTGMDIHVRGFDRQGAPGSGEGTPVFGVLDGVVIYASDGHPDRNDNAHGHANAVVLDHGNGQRTFYWHMKRGSLTHREGDIVRAGEQLGLVGSSGQSSWPHLHFEAQQNGVIVETTSGACVSGSGLWPTPPVVVSVPRVLEAGVSAESLLGVRPPWSLPRASHIALTDARVSMWMLVQNLAQQSVGRTRLVDPSGALVAESPTVPLAGDAAALSTVHAQWPIGALGGRTGEWRMQWFLNGNLSADIPFTVLAAPSPGFNRPPDGLIVSLEPTPLLESEPVRCVVRSESTFGDPDLDVVRYEYVWTVNDDEIRRVTSFAMSDVLPASSAGALQRVVCTVRALDGTLASPPARAEAIVGEPCASPLAQALHQQGSPLGHLLSGLGESTGATIPDFDHDGFVTMADLSLLLSWLGANCPD